MIGKVMLGVGVLIAHSELAQEKIVDQQVLRSFRIERVLTIVGLLLIVGGYGLEIIFYNFFDMLTCFGEECVMEAAAVLSQ